MISITCFVLIFLNLSVTSEAFTVVPNQRGSTGITRIPNENILNNHRNLALQAATLMPPSTSTTTQTEKPSISVQKQPVPTVVEEEEVLGTRPRIVTIDSAEDYKAFLEEDDDNERLAIIKFHATWCKKCQHFGEQYKRVAREIGDLEEVTTSNCDGSDKEDSTIVQTGDVRFGEIEYGSNTELCKQLGVTKLPAVHIYSSKGKLVDAFRAQPLSKFLDKIDLYMSMDPSEIDFEADMFQGSMLGDTVLNSLSSPSSSTATAGKSS